MHHLEISRDNVELSYQDAKSHKNDRLAMVQIEKINLHNNGINKKKQARYFLAEQSMRTFSPSNL